VCHTVLNYVWRYGVQCRGIDGRPGESHFRRASWCALFPPRSGFEGGHVGIPHLVAARALTRGCG
jgi:hypothetical protein